MGIPAAAQLSSQAHCAGPSRSRSRPWTATAVLRAILVACTLALLASPARAADLTALARVGSGGDVSDASDGLQLDLPLSQGVPWRVFTLSDPWRVVLDFSTVDWSGFDPAAFNRSRHVTEVRTGAIQPGWSRMVMDVDRPLVLKTAALDTAGGQARLVAAFQRADESVARAAAGTPASAVFDLPVPAPPAADAPAKRRQLGDRPLVVMLDPGHGGIDPGAQRDGVDEKTLTLTFALELRDVLRRAGMTVGMTRTDDRFVPLETRITLARSAGADVMLSIHADAIAEGRASGATVYTLAAEASDQASRQLAERHDRDDLLSGVDLTHQDDVVAGVLMSLARTETTPRSTRLAEALVASLDKVVKMHKRPRLQADFSVLKAPDIPSALIEIGFLSSDRDRARLEDQAWRAGAEAAIRDALLDWARTDAAEAQLVRH